MSSGLYRFQACRYDSSVIFGTLFQDTHKPLRLWFHAIWYVVSQKKGVSALGLQKALGLGSYHTAWEWLHKLRRIHLGGIGRIRLSTISDASGEVLTNAVQEMVSEGSTIRTDGWAGYSGLSDLGYVHLPMSNHNVKEDDVIEVTHLVVSLLKRWLIGALHGGISHKNLLYYLDEFTFRFNRRTSTSRGKLFLRLIEQALAIDPVPAKSLNTICSG